jgi:alanyl-tRNA synthetase
VGITTDFIAETVPVIAEIYGEFYPDIKTKQATVITLLQQEEQAFRRTLGKGLRVLQKLAESGLSGEELFKLHDTYGFPLELSIEEARRRDIKLSDAWQQEFDAAMERQRATSRTATKGMFKGGLSDDSETTTKYHTATHLLLAALQQVLDPEVEQKGSNITADRIRFDFGWPDKVTPEQIAAVEQLVNDWIEADLPVVHDEYDTDFAFETLKAHGSFREKYGDQVTVYTIGEFEQPISREICGGPHVTHTGTLGADGKRFKITKEESSSAGVRRVKAVLL